MEKPPKPNTIDGMQVSVTVEAETEKFIGLLDQDHTAEELKAAYDGLVKVMTLETFKLIKEKQEEQQTLGDPNGDIDKEINMMKE